jgi:NTP pyrophosphatase (non-canonical NTP hydrolase)
MTESKSATPQPVDLVDFSQYVASAKETESLPLDLEVDIIKLVQVLNLVSSSCQLLDLYKKQMFYRKKFDTNTEKQLIDSMEFQLAQVANNDYPVNVGKIPVRLSHSIVGIATEAGELVDSLIPVLDAAYPLDSINFKEELGDVMWYAAIGLDVTGNTLKDTLDTNIRKLQDKKKGRYASGKFTEAEAEHRDLVAERELLEKAQ